MAPGCGLRIGGQNHVAVSTVKRISAADLAGQTQPGYIASAVSGANADKVLRAIDNTLALRVLRFLMHSFLRLRESAANPKQSRQLVKDLGLRVSSELAEHMREDWAAMRRKTDLSSADLAMFLHAMLGFGANTLFFSEDRDRGAYEYDVMHTVVQPAVESLLDSRQGGTLDALRSTLASGRSANALVAMLGLEDHAALYEEAAGAPVGQMLWRFRQPVSFEHFRRCFELQHGGSAASAWAPHTLLRAFLREEARLPVIRHMGAVLQWHALLFEAFSHSGPISREDALSVSNLEAVRRLPEGRREQGRRVLASFICAFNEAFPLVALLHECNENPFVALVDDPRPREAGQAVRERVRVVDLSGMGGRMAGGPVAMGEDTPVSFSLPSLVQGGADAQGPSCHSSLARFYPVSQSLLGHRALKHECQLHQRAQSARLLLMPSPLPQVCARSSC